jgi:hypothetical protein
MFRNPGSKRNVITIFLGALAMAAITIATVALTPKRAVADEGVAIKGNFTVSIAFIQNVSACGVGDNCITCVSSDPPRFYIHAEGIGDTGKLGTMFFKIEKCLDPTKSEFGSYEGIFTMTAPNGKDSLTGTYTGKNTNAGNIYNFGPFSGDLNITGGTGRFDDAKGRAHFTAIADNATATAYYAVEGHVSSRD